MPSDVLLIVEVSDSTLRYDRGTKLRLYARHAMPEFWIVDVKAQRVECYRRPVDGTYTEKSVLEKGGTLTLQAMPDVRIAVADIFPSG